MSRVFSIKHNKTINSDSERMSLVSWPRCSLDQGRHLLVTCKHNKPFKCGFREHPQLPHVVFNVCFIETIALPLGCPSFTGRQAFWKRQIVSWPRGSSWGKCQRLGNRGHWRRSTGTAWSMGCLLEVTGSVIQTSLICQLFTTKCVFEMSFLKITCSEQLN